MKKHLVRNFAAVLAILLALSVSIAELSQAAFSAANPSLPISDSIRAPRSIAAMYPETAQLSAAESQEFDYFGGAVAVSGTTVVAGACGEDGGPGDPVPGAGAAYVFERDEGGPGNWGLAVKLTAGDPHEFDCFGISVAISGDTIVVGANKYDAGTGGWAADAGAAYVFERNLGGPGAWGQAALLTASDYDGGEEFGGAVAISGSTIVVGAVYESILTMSQVGAAYVYERDLGGPGNWGEAVKLMASDASDGDYFAWSVGVHGDTIVAGARYEDGGAGDPLPGAGAAYIFERDHGGPDNWGETTRLTAGDAQPDDEFGISAAIGGDVIVIGAHYEDGGPGDPLYRAGAAYVFERDLGGPGSWGEAARLTASDAQSEDYFGSSAAVAEGGIVIGAWSENGGSGDPIWNAGAAYVFERDLGGPGIWGEAAKLMAGDAADSALYGGWVASDGLRIVAGARGAETAYVYLRLGQSAFLPEVINCLPFYQDDFSNPASGWPVVDTGNTLYEYRNGEYRILVKNAFGIGGAYPGPIFSDYLVTAEVRNPFNRAGTYGLLFGHMDWTKFYTFEIDTEQHYEIWVYNSGWSLLAQGSSTALKPGTAKNTIAIERAGSSIQAFANGTLIDSIVNGAIIGNLHVGVWVTGSVDDGLDIRWDDYKVEALGCGWSGAQASGAGGVPGSGAAVPVGPGWVAQDLPRRDQ